tara:strand:- start:93 stop:1886 length:1794 start_codon:yes stop_codon:yes gene_type:complete
MAIEFLDDVKVGASLEVTGSFKDAATSAGTNGYILSSTTIGTAWIDPNTLDNIGSTDLTLSANRILYFGAGGLSNKTLEFVDNVNTSVRIIKFTDADIEMAKEVHLKSVSATTVPLHFHGPSSSAFSVSLQAPTLIASTAYTLPDADGTTKQFLSTNGVAELSWLDAENIGNNNLAIPGTSISRILTISSGVGSNFKIIDSNTNPFIKFEKGATDIYSTLKILSKSGSNFGGILQIFEGDNYGSGFVGLKVGASHSASVIYTLPTGPPASNQVLQSTSAGIMSWVASGGSNIGNSDLTTDATDRKLILFSNISRFAIYRTGGTELLAQFYPDIVQFNSNSVYITSPTGETSAPILYLREAESSGNNEIGLRAPDNLAANQTYTLPGTAPTTGQVLSSSAGGVMSWGDAGASAPSLIASGGGRVYMATSSDANARAVVLGGSIGFGFYNWSTVISFTSLSFTGLGTPNSDTTSVTPANCAQGAFQVLKSGTIKVQGTVEGQSSSELYSANVYILVFKISAAIVTAMGNGNPQNNTTYTLVASAECTMPASSTASRPQSFASSNGVSVSAGDWVFASLASDATVTATRYFYTNFQMLTS